MNIAKVQWIKSRKKLIFRSLSDFFIIYYFCDNIYSAPLALIISSFWCLLNYLTGIYPNKIKPCKIRSILFINTKQIIVNYLILIFLAKILILINILNFDFIYLSFTFLKIIIITSSLQAIYSIYFQRNLKKKINLCFLGSKDSYKKVIKISDFENLEINIIFNKEINKNNLFKGYIVENIKSVSDQDKENILLESIKGKKIYNLIDWYEEFLNRIPSEIISSTDLLNIDFSSKVDSFQMRLKRIGDLFFSLVILIFASPILIIASIIIYFEDEGPIFYSQIRTGLMNKEIRIIKLRTMKIDAEKNGPQWSSNNDLRVTNIGKILRKYRIDEIPQLVSVLKGDMSLIGPRPERPEIDLQLAEEITNYNFKYLSKPGLSGWAQVNYPYGASKLDSKIKLSYDLYYLKNFSIWLDLLIFFKTIKLVVNGDGSMPNN